MPADFMMCEKNGGKMRTIKGPNRRFGLKAGEYLYVCFDSKGMHRGEKMDKMEKDMKKM